MTPRADALLDLPVVELRDRLASGAARAEEVAAATNARIAAREPEVRAFAHHEPDHVLRQAKAIDRFRGTGRAVGRLHGLPVAVKDIVDTGWYPTANGTPLDEGRRPEADADIVDRLRAEGAILAGKAVTTELAYLAPSATRNPHDLERTPGGSSSGSAAAVAAGMVPLAIGSQTGGSVIRPASYCGTVGYKPSFGAISTRGVLKQSPSLDTLGTFARSVEGAALLTDAIWGGEEPGPAPRLFDAARSTPPMPPTFAFVRTPWWDSAEPEMRQAMEELVAALGGRCFEAELPEPFERAVEVRRTINDAEMAHAFAPYERRGRERLSEAMREALDRGRRVSARDYLAALDWRGVYAAGLDAVFERCDAILTLAAQGPAPRDLSTTGDSRFNALWTMVGTPAITLPVFDAGEGGRSAPMGVQLVARRRDDARLMRNAAWLERFVADPDAALAETARGRARERDALGERA